MLFRGLLQRRHPRQDDLDPRASAGLGIEVEPAAETVGDDAVDDVQAQARCRPDRGASVKNGSKARRRTSRLMPQPLSEKMISTLSLPDSAHLDIDRRRACRPERRAPPN